MAEVDESDWLFDSRRDYLEQMTMQDPTPVAATWAVFARAPFWRRTLIPSLPGAA